jgi:hypothetical protein
MISNSLVKPFVVITSVHVQDMAVSGVLNSSGQSLEHSVRHLTVMTTEELL